MGIGSRLRAARLTRNMTLAMLADASRLSKGFISQVENGLSSPSLFTLQKLADVLTVPVSELIAEQPDQPPAPARQGIQPRVIRRRPLDARANHASQVEVVCHLASGTLLNAALSYSAVLHSTPNSGVGESKEALCYLAKGSLTFYQGKHSLELSDGDSLTWDAGREYSFENQRQSSSKLLLLIPEGRSLPEISHPHPANEPARNSLSYTGPFRLVEMRAQREAMRGR